MVYDKHGESKEVHNPSGLPDATMIDHIEEPYIKASIITDTNYIGPIMKLCLDKRGELLKQEYISGNRVDLHFMLPLGEIVIDFYDKLKSISKGYASFDYHVDCYRLSKLAKLDILLNGEPVDALSTLTHQDNAVAFGRRICEKLKELIPRQQFDIAIQAAIGAKIVARETIKCVRKDVTAKCYGGDVSRKRKLLEKQKKGKKRMKQIGKGRSDLVRATGEQLHLQKRKRAVCPQCFVKRDRAAPFGDGVVINAHGIALCILA